MVRRPTASFWIGRTTRACRQRRWQRLWPRLPMPAPQDRAPVLTTSWARAESCCPSTTPPGAKRQATTDALLTGSSSVQLNGPSYAYYMYNPSTSDISQITVTAAAQKQAYTREACVRLQSNGLGYCAGLGASVNGVYSGCFIAKGGQYLANMSCGSPSSSAPHTLAIVASGTLPVVLQVYLDGVPAKAAADYSPLPKSHPGIGLCERRYALQHRYECMARLP